LLRGFQQTGRRKAVVKIPRNSEDTEGKQKILGLQQHKKKKRQKDPLEHGKNSPKGEGRKGGKREGLDKKIAKKVGKPILKKQKEQEQPMLHKKVGISIKREKGGR